MTSKASKIELIVDGIKLTSEGSEVQLIINGSPTYSNVCNAIPKLPKKTKDFQTLEISYALRIINTMFGNNERHRIILSLIESAKSFTELQKTLESKPASLDFHLKKLLTEMVIYKNNDKKYALSVIGREFYNYFTEFLKPIEELNIK
jgi:hypothetical protein